MIIEKVISLELCSHLTKFSPVLLPEILTEIIREKNKVEMGLLPI